MVFVEILLPIFLLIAAGALFSRILKPTLEPLTQLALFLAAPALVFHALVRYPISFQEVGRLMALMVLYVGILWALSEFLVRVLRLEDSLGRAFLLATVPMNVGNYGLPLVRFALGPETEGFSILVFVVFNIPLVTWAIWVAAGGTLGSARGMKDALKIPIFQATLLAFLFGGLGWTLPSPLSKSLGLLAQAAIPLFLVILGMQLDRTRIDRWGWDLGLAVFVRLAVSPFLAFGLAHLCGFQGLPVKVIVLQTSTPSAVLTLLYALRFGCQPQWMASVIFFSTVFSVASLSVILTVLL